MGAISRHRKRCESKTESECVFESVSDATWAAKKARHASGLWITPYLCRWCGKYHIGKAYNSRFQPHLANKIKCDNKEEAIHSNTPPPRQCEVAE